MMNHNRFMPQILLITLLTLAPFTCRADIMNTFRQPAAEARPWTFWFWINGNISREGITADLEAMARVGIGGVLIMEVANPKNMAPEGPVKFASPEWNSLFQHVLSEAKRLGLQVNMNNDAGWCGSGGPWMTPEESMKQIVATTTTLTGPSHVDVVMPTPETIEGFYRDIALFAAPDSDTSASVIQLTDRMTSEGRVTWDAPAGTWQLMRVGYTSTGRKNKPAPKSGEGLEADKFDPKAIATHFNAFIRKLTQQNSDLVGSTFVNTHIDSWEVGTQTWSENFAEEFRQRRGYDVMPWLAVLAGAKTGTTETLERFRRDFTLTCSELNDDNYAGALRKLANEQGLKLSIEAYGQAGFLNPLTYGAEADMPVSEFWISRWDAWHLLSPRLMASVAHVFGRQITGAESFTSMPDKDPFTEHPYSVKTTGDWAMTEGVNRIIFHRTVHDPWKNLLPGMSFAGFGWHVDRNQTWFEQSAPFMQYLARCQSILQHGTFVADVCRLIPDGETRGNTPGMHQIPKQYEALPAGYNYDYISDKALLSEMSVRDGKLVTRGGMEYNALQLPRYTTMTVELARKINELVADGATVVGPKPTQTPGLTNYPNCDAELREIADKAWDVNSDRHVVSNRPVADVLSARGFAPDFLYEIDPPVTNDAIKSITGRSVKKPKGPVPLEMPTQGLNWIHRSLPEGDFYFVANPQYRDVNALCTFRIEGRMPELWYPDSGEIRAPAVFQSDANMQLPIHFKPAESVFVVFRKQLDPSRQIVDLRSNAKPLFGTDGRPQKLPPVWETDGKLVMQAGESAQYQFKFADGKSATVNIPKPAEPIHVNGPWKVKFPADLGAPDQAEFPQLVDWSKHENQGIKYFSGTATYRTSFNNELSNSANTSWTLDLGEVLVMAEVRLNGKDLGVLWKQPFTIGVTEALRPGANELEIKVTNLWPNRMIGDEQYPDDSSPDGSWVRGPLKSWPDWIKNSTARPDPRRVTFTTFKYFQKDSPLTPSGLLGPVQVRPVYSQLIKHP